LLEPEHGLIVQSYAPRRQPHRRMNADGWGAGFFAAGRPEPARWRSNRPLWAVALFASVALVVASSCVLAAVRSATAGMPLDETATAPFARGRYLLSHNGVADRSILGLRPHAESACDSAQLAARLFDLGPERAGEFVRDLGKRDPDARLNLLLTDGRRIIATRWNDTLSILHTRGGVVVASDPYTTTRAGPTSPTITSSTWPTAW
jgi:gamma-glutamyl hercynylcysteine S-oxide hydrolase